MQTLTTALGQCLDNAETTVPLPSRGCPTFILRSQLIKPIECDGRAMCVNAPLGNTLALRVLSPFLVLSYVVSRASRRRCTLHARISIGHAQRRGKNNTICCWRLVLFFSPVTTTTTTAACFLLLARSTLSLSCSRNSMDPRERCNLIQEPGEISSIQFDYCQ